MADDARTIPMWKPFCRDDLDGKRRPWPKIRLRALDPRPKVDPESISSLPESRAIRIKARAKDERRMPLEVLSRLGGGTTFKEPTYGRSTSTRASGNDDLAAALGFVKDPLQQRLALALSCHTDAEWLEVQRMAHPLLMKQLHGSHATRSMVAGKLKYRARVVLHAAFHDLVLLRTPTSDTNASTQLDMKVKDYQKLYSVVAGFIETIAQEGARIAVDAFFNES